MRELPLNGRNVMNLIALAPGVVPGGSSAGGTGLNQGTRSGNQGWGNYQIGGAIQGQGTEYVDGSPINVLGGNTVALVMTQDAVQELSVITSNAGADFGRSAGGVVNMTSRSGTGRMARIGVRIFRKHRPERQQFLQQPARRSSASRIIRTSMALCSAGQSGRTKRSSSLTGRDSQRVIGESSPTNVPTQAMRNGVFTNPISDPLGNCNIVHNPGAGTWTITNLWQGACGDPLAHILMNYYPLPNTSGAFNWFLTTPITNHQNQYNGRFDYSISPRQRALWPLHLLDPARYRVLGIQRCRRLAYRQWPRHQRLAAGCTRRHLHH